MSRSFVPFAELQDRQAGARFSHWLLRLSETGLMWSSVSDGRPQYTHGSVRISSAYRTASSSKAAAIRGKSTRGFRWRYLRWFALNFSGLRRAHSAFCWVRAAVHPMQRQPRLYSEDVPCATGTRRPVLFLRGFGGIFGCRARQARDASAHHFLQTSQRQPRLYPIRRPCSSSATGRDFAISLFHRVRHVAPQNF